MTKNQKQVPIDLDKKLKQTEEVNFISILIFKYYKAIDLADSLLNKFGFNNYLTKENMAELKKHNNNLKK